jgi:hypothetical protein
VKQAIEEGIKFHPSINSAFNLHETVPSEQEMLLYFSVLEKKKKKNTYIKKKIVKSVVNNNKEIASLKRI